MSAEGLEQRLKSQPLRHVPTEWRGEILLAARQAAQAQEVPRATRQALAHSSLLSTLLWPHPAAWAGLAAVWLVILGVNLTTRDATLLEAKRASSASPQVFMAYQEQERLLAELLRPREAPVVEPPQPVPPRPRSERRNALLMA